MRGTEPPPEPAPPTTPGRLLNSRDAAVPVVRGVAGELTADAEMRRVLVQAVLASLTPDPIR